MTTVVILVSDGPAGGQCLHQLLATAGDLTVNCVLALGPELPEALSRCGGELAVVYAPGGCRGACGYLVDSLPAAQLRDALAMPARLDAQPAGSRVVVLSQPVPAPRAGGAELLSEREQEVIELIAQACTNAQIARRLGIAEGTVKRHVNSIFIKLGAVSRLDAVNKHTERRTARSARPFDPGAVPMG